MGQESSVGIAIRFGLDDQGSNPGGTRFSAPVQTRPAAHPEVKRPGRGVYHLLPLRGDVKERVDRYLYSPSETSWSVLG